MCVVCLYGFRPVYFCATFNLSFPLTHIIHNTYVRFVCVCRKCASHLACAIIMCSCVLCVSLWWCWKETTQMTQVACFRVSSTLFLYYSLSLSFSLALSLPLSLTHSLNIEIYIYSDHHLHIVLGVSFFLLFCGFLRWQSIFSSSIGWCSLICATQNDYVIFKYSYRLDWIIAIHRKARNRLQFFFHSSKTLFIDSFSHIIIIFPADTIYCPLQQ